MYRLVCCLLYFERSAHFASAQCMRAIAKEFTFVAARSHVLLSKLFIIIIFFSASLLNPFRFFVCFKRIRFTLKIKTQSLNDNEMKRRKTRKKHLFCSLDLETQSTAKRRPHTHKHFSCNGECTSNIIMIIFHVFTSSRTVWLDVRRRTVLICVIQNCQATNEGNNNTIDEFTRLQPIVIVVMVVVIISKCAKFFYRLASTAQVSHLQ